MRIHLGLAFSLAIAAASSGAEQLNYTPSPWQLPEGAFSQQIRDLKTGSKAPSGMPLVVRSVARARPVGTHASNVLTHVTRVEVAPVTANYLQYAC